MTKLEIIDELLNTIKELGGVKAYIEAGLQEVETFVAECKNWAIEEQEQKDEEDLSEIAKEALTWTEEEIEGISETLFEALKEENERHSLTE